MRYLTFTLIFLATSLLAQNNGWQPLFNENDLSEWTQRGSNASYTLEDGVIVGTSVQTPKNSFLCTNQTYGDFILELEVKLDHGINSGIQIRSESKADYYNGRVHGYQVELDPSPIRRWTAGIYDEGRRGWLYPLTRNPKGQDAFIIGDWNKIRIEAIGHHIRTWVNGVQCANLVDDMTAKGFIGLQVHGIGKNEKPGKQIRWKNIRIKTIDLEDESWETAPYATEINYIPNHLTENEKRKGWRLLWDGETFEGWNDNHSKEKVDTQYWKIKDNAIYTNNMLSVLKTNQQFSDFELEFEYLLTDEDVNGTLYYVVQNRYPVTYNLIQQQKVNLDGKLYPPGSVNNLIPSENLSDASSDKLRFGAKNYWNKSRIVVKNGYVEHWLNNIKVVEYDSNSQLFRVFIKQSFQNSDIETPKDSYLAFSSLYGIVKLRSIKIREM